MSRARLAAALREGLPLLLLLSALSARSLLLSAARPVPLYDEVAYMQEAHETAARGVAATAACYLRGRCRADNRHPLYMFLAAPFLKGGPEDFARAKLVSLATALLLVLCVYGLGRFTWGPGAALFAAGAVALSWQAATLSCSVLGDTLFAALFFSALAALALSVEGRAGWLAFGFLAGLAYLAKGSGHLLLLGAAAAAADRARRGRPWAALLACAAGGFLLGGFIVLWRNTLVWHWPLHNFNDKVIWLDSWEQQWLLQNSPERWARLGPADYLRHHSLAELAARLFGGMEKVGRALLATLTAWPFSAASGFTGPLLLAAACVGLRLRWIEGRREETLAVGAATGVLFLAHCWAGVPDPRYMLPVAAALAPYAGLAARAAWRAAWAEAPAYERFRPYALSGAACLAAALALAGAAEGFSYDPLSLWAEPAHWRDAGDWIEARVPPSRIAVPPWSRFSVWDMPGDLEVRCPYDVFDADLRACVDAGGAGFILLDAADASYSQWPARFGKVDAYGPVSYLGWPRVYHDPLKPSQLLIFQRPAAGARK